MLNYSVAELRNNMYNMVAYMGTQIILPVKELMK